MPKVLSLARARRLGTDSAAINALYLPVPGIMTGQGAEPDNCFAKVPTKNGHFEELYENT